MSLTDEILRVTNSILSEKTRAWLGWNGSPYSSLSAREDLRNSERIGWDEGISIEEKEFVTTYAAIAFEYVRNQRLDALDIPSSDAANLAQWIATQLEASKVRQADAPASSAPITERVTWVSALARNLKTALARPTMVRAPRPIIDGMLEIREGYSETKPELRPAEKRQLDKLPLDRTGRTFRTFADAPLLRIVHEPRSGDQLALFLPVGEDQRERVKPGRVDVGVFGREFLSGSLLRTYMAMWALANEEGLFLNEPRRVLVELFGARTVNAGVKKSDGTKPYERLHSKIEREWNENFERLLFCYVESLGNVEVMNRQPLITGYRNKNTGAAVFEHARLALFAMRKNFVQVPLEALRLDPRSIPLALNIASLWRARIRDSVIRGPGRLALSLRELAIALRDDPDTKSRHDGATAYWKKFQERVTGVVHDGGLGTIQIAGDGPTASVVMVPSNALEAVYSSLGELPTPPSTLQPPSPSPGRRRKSPRLPG